MDGHTNIGTYGWTDGRTALLIRHKDASNKATELGIVPLEKSFFIYDDEHIIFKFLNFGSKISELRCKKMRGYLVIYKKIVEIHIVIYIYNENL